MEHPVPKLSLLNGITFNGASEYARAKGVTNEYANKMLVRTDDEEVVVYDTKTKTTSPITNYGENVKYAYNPVIRFMLPGSSFEITYDAKGGEIDSNSQRVPYEQRFNVNLKYPLMEDDYIYDANGIPSKYEFQYWLDKASNMMYRYQINELEDDIHLEACYDYEEYRKNVTINYHLGNKEAVNDPNNPTTCEIGKKLYLNDPACPGEVFEGWYYDSKFTQYAGKNVIDNFGAWQKPTVFGIALYAKWQASTCDIYYHDDTGQTINSKNPIHYIHNSTTPLPLYPQAIQSGYKFLYWSYEGNKVDEITPEMMKKDSISLTAVYETMSSSSKSFYITYDFNCDDAICWNEGDYTTSYNFYTSSITYPNLQRDGYELDGWSLDGGLTKVTHQTQILWQYENVLLTAMWKEVSA